jgi:hypothetical protein
VRVFRLGEEPGDDLSSTTAEERLAMVSSASVTGVAFEPAWSGRSRHTLFGMEVPFLGRRDLIANERATGRTKDLADLEALETDRE